MFIFHSFPNSFFNFNFDSEWKFWLIQREYGRMVKKISISLIWMKYRSLSPSINPRLHSIQMSILIRTLRTKCDYEAIFRWQAVSLAGSWLIQRFGSQQTNQFSFQIFKHQLTIKKRDQRNFFFFSHPTQLERKVPQQVYQHKYFYFIAKVLDFFRAPRELRPRRGGLIR